MKPQAMQKASGGSHEVSPSALVKKVATYFGPVPLVSQRNGDLVKLAVHWVLPSLDASLVLFLLGFLFGL